MQNPQPDPEKTPDTNSESASRLDSENASGLDSESATRPDPRQGVFETLLVAGGQPVELDAHMARLAASLRELYGAELDAGAADLVTEAAQGLGVGRVRLTALPQDSGIAVEAHGEAIDPTAAFALATRAVAMRSFVVPGGLGPHKWADRTFLERAEAKTSADGERGAGTRTDADTRTGAGGKRAADARLPRGEARATASGRVPGDDAAPTTVLPLLLDEDGSVLEASRANVFAVRDGALLTPPLDGRILPGVGRAALIEVARETGREVREESLTAADLTAADGVFLTGSVRGVQPAVSLDGTALGTTDATALLAATLRRRWLRTRPTRNAATDTRP